MEQLVLLNLSIVKVSSVRSDDYFFVYEMSPIFLSFFLFFLHKSLLTFKSSPAYIITTKVVYVCLVIFIIIQRTVCNFILAIILLMVYTFRHL